MDLIKRRIPIGLKNVKYILDEIENVQEHYWELYKECGEDEVKKQLRSYQKSCERIDINSWRAALYSALSLQYHEFCEWLKKTCKR